MEVNIKSVLITLFSGFSFRNKVENDPSGDLSVIQMKDLEHNYSSIGLSTLTKISSNEVSSKLFLVGGDVLFIAKGSNNFALEYNLDVTKAIASSAFFVLRVDKSRILPAYLSWYINQQPMQQYLKENMAGTYIPNINKSAIEGITIVLPSIEIQKKIVLVDSLRKRERLLMISIIDKREVVVNAALLDIVKN